ncbi:oxidoreductase [Paractinoplanes deccanensis]|uniref:Oxidoreductase n=1 Tax=Paractinoplanes deccanensis TaxID=113561 RepID=A0ABQ3YC96_9ACTN|nr:PhzF family phenazine biosynthesis protein [Actinoplanes deccanensis]GID77646.1 oxidoreductase [Actinoplanes deccanensis]
MRIRIIDAFTDRPFAGNPAGVVVLDGPEFPGEEWMQAVAAEVNLSETAFLHPLPPGGDADYALRWFTPAVEVALCGHATLATAHALESKGVVRFATRSGILTASTDGEGWITLDFPTAPLSPFQADPRVLDALGVTPLSVHHTGPNTDDLLIEVLDEEAVRSLTPDLTALATFENRGVVVTARASGEGYDFVSRFFGAAAGVGEDPVTGSAHTALAPFWSARLGGRTELVGYQASPRGGYVRVSLRDDRTLLTGKAVTVIDGTLHT